MRPELPLRPSRPGETLTRRLGLVLTDSGLISHADLERALARQVRTGERLGHVLMAMGLLSEEELGLALTLQRSFTSLDATLAAAAGARERLGDLLLASGRVTRAALAEALELQELRGGKLGEILVSLGALTAAELEAALAFQERQEQPAPAGPLRLGEILVATGRISREQLRRALDRQADSGEPLGEVLVGEGAVDRETLGGALRLQRVFTRAALAALLAVAALYAAPADGAEARRAASTRLQVSVTVMGRAVLTPLRQQAELVITAADVRRGFVDAPTATSAEVVSNSRDGYLLTFQNLAPFCRQVKVSGLGPEVVLSGAEGWVHQAYHVGTRKLELGYRFILAPEAQPGTYAWPLVLAAEAR